MITNSLALLVSNLNMQVDHELCIVTYKIYGSPLNTQIFSNTKHSLEMNHLAYLVEPE